MYRKKRIRMLLLIAGVIGLSTPGFAPVTACADPETAVEEGDGMAAAREDDSKVGEEDTEDGQEGKTEASPDTAEDGQAEKTEASSDTAEDGQAEKTEDASESGKEEGESVSSSDGAAESSDKEKTEDMRRIDWITDLIQLCKTYGRFPERQTEPSEGMWYEELLTGDGEQREDLRTAFYAGLLPASLFQTEPEDGEEENGSGDGLLLDASVDREFAAVTLDRFLGLSGPDTQPISTEDEDLLSEPVAAAAASIFLFSDQDSIRDWEQMLDLKGKNFEGTRKLEKKEAERILQLVGQYLKEHQDSEETEPEGAGTDRLADGQSGSAEPETGPPDGEGSGEELEKNLEEDLPADSENPDESEAMPEETDEPADDDPLGVQGDVFGDGRTRFGYRLDEDRSTITLTAWYGSTDPEVIIRPVTVIGEKEYQIEICGEDFFEESYYETMDLFEDDEDVPPEEEPEPSEEEEESPVRIKKLTFLSEDGNRVKVADLRLTRCLKDCTELESVDLSGLDVSDVTDMEQMFCGCSSLNTVKLPEGDPGKLENAAEMFRDCESLKELDLSGRKAERLLNAEAMLFGCRSLESLHMRDVQMPSLDNFRDFCRGCIRLSRVELEGFQAPVLTKMGGSFAECAALQSLDFSGAKLSHVTSLEGCFQSCGKLQTLNLSGLQAEPVRSLYLMCGGCESLKDYTAPSGTFRDLRTAAGAFEECRALTDLDPGQVSGGTLTDIRKMFLDCTALELADLSGWDLSAAAECSSVFENCHGLREIRFPSDTRTVRAEIMSRMFYGCKSLKQVNLSALDTSAAVRMDHMFAGCESLHDPDLSGFDTAKVVDMSGMFDGCRSIEVLDLGSFDTGAVWDDGMRIGGDGYTLKAVVLPKVIGEDFVCEIYRTQEEKVLTIDHTLPDGFWDHWSGREIQVK